MLQSFVQAAALPKSRVPLLSKCDILGGAAMRPHCFGIVRCA